MLRPNILSPFSSATCGQQEQGSGVMASRAAHPRSLLPARRSSSGAGPDDPRRCGVPADALAALRGRSRRDLERRPVQRSGQLPPSRPLGRAGRGRSLLWPLPDCLPLPSVLRPSWRRRLALQGRQNRRVHRTTRTWTSQHYARLPCNWRRPPSSCATGRGGRGDRDLRAVRRSPPSSPSWLRCSFCRACTPWHDSFRKIGARSVHRADQRGPRRVRARRDFRAVSGEFPPTPGWRTSRCYTDSACCNRAVGADRDTITRARHFHRLGYARTTSRPARRGVGQVASRAGHLLVNPGLRPVLELRRLVIAPTRAVLGTAF